jgi:protein-L-isoaspartate(D-aspartate) O-methyltransferase
MIAIMEPPASMDQLADVLVATGSITSPAVEAAFRAVPRHLFVPEVAIEHAYRNEAIPTKMLDGQAVSSASQPSIVAVMLEQLDVKPGQRVLEVGAGTGYNAALLAHLVGTDGRVVTVDIDQDVVDGARAHLATAGVEGVEVVCGDGGLGYSAVAPYDRIIVTAGAWDVAPAWWQQLAHGGRLLLPLSLRGVQRCVALERHDGWLQSVSIRDCGFMRLRGAFRGPEAVVTAGSVTITFDSEVDTARLPTTLTRDAGERSVRTAISDDEAFGGLALWLALHDPGYCSVNAVWGRGDTPPLPVATTFPFGEGSIGWSPASFQQSSLAVLGRGPHGLVVHAYGDDAESAERLTEKVDHWHAAGRPDSRSLALGVYPASEPVPDTAAGLIRIPKRWTTTLVEWPGARP